MNDLEPMGGCPWNPRYAHSFVAVVPGDDEGDLTLFCSRCAAVRRLPVKGPMGRPLDDYTAATIAERSDRR